MSRQPNLRAIRGLVVPKVPNHLPSRQPRRQIVLPSDVGQAALAPFEQIGQLLVVEAEQREHRGVQIVNVHFVVDGAKA